MITTATSSGAPAQWGRLDRMLAQPDQDDWLMRPGHLRWTLGAGRRPAIRACGALSVLSDRRRHKQARPGVCDDNITRVDRR
jgi:hypothetical protein